MLARRYPAPAFALIAQVRDSTGAGASRTADALAFSLWPSRGLGIEGFECKSSRSDWLKELADPTKAGEFQKFCRRWWMVTAADDIIQAGELPATWGHLSVTPNGQGLRVVKEAPELDCREPDLPLLCAIMRRVTDATISREEHHDIVQRARADAKEQAMQEALKTPEQGFEQAFRELRAKVDEFKQATGVDLDWRFDSERHKEAFKLLLDRGYFRGAAKVLEGEAESLDGAAQAIRERLAKLQQAQKLIETPEAARG
jgi:hypothetical protein